MHYNNLAVGKTSRNERNTCVVGNTSVASILSELPQNRAEQYLCCAIHDLIFATVQTANIYENGKYRGKCICTENDKRFQKFFCIRRFVASYFVSSVAKSTRERHNCQTIALCYLTTLGKRITVHTLNDYVYLHLSQVFDFLMFISSMLRFYWPERNDNKTCSV